MFDEVTVKASGSVNRETHCAGCSTTYYYLLTRSVATTRRGGLSRDGATADASRVTEKRLAERLATESDPVPCPACGAYQPEMFEGLRCAKFRWVRGTAIVLFCLAVLVGGLWGIGTGNRRPRPEEEAMQLWFGIGAVAFLAGSFALMLVYFAKKRGYDPNTTPVETRLAAARLRAATADEVRDGYSGIAAPKPWNMRGR